LVQGACDMHILVPPKKEAAVFGLSIGQCHATVIMEALLRWGTGRLNSQPRSCDSSPMELSSSRRLGFGEVRRQSDASHIQQRANANSDASRLPMYSHIGNLTSHLNAVSYFDPFGIFRESGFGRNFCVVSWTLHA
jgi:hypothetical protein